MKNFAIGKGSIKFFKCATVILAVLVTVCVIIALTTNLAVYFSVQARVVDNADSVTLENADCILVLGAGVRADGTPSNMLEDRLRVGIELYKTGKCATLLMSGDHGTLEYDEVNCMKNYAVEAGVPAERIFMDHAGFSTYDSLYRAKHVFGAERIIIVTQEYHLYRALYIARSLGLEAVGVSADLREYSGQSVRDARELLARTKDFTLCIFKPRSKYLGEHISLDGNGDITAG